MQFLQRGSGEHHWKVTSMFLCLAAGILFAAGQHLFYQRLEGTTPPNASLSFLGLEGGVSEQQINISIGNTLAFLAKSCLALSVAAAHEQVSWRTIKNRPTKLGRIDSLFAARNDVISAFNVWVWATMPFASFLLLLFWLLPLALLISPAALTIESVMLDSMTNMRVPQIDFSSLNFPSLSYSAKSVFVHMPNPGSQVTTDLTYNKPQYPVQKMVQGSLISNSIMPISAPSSNSSWSLDFYGPALSCTILDDTDNDGFRRKVLRNYGEGFYYGAFMWLAYLAWVPDASDATNGSLPFTGEFENCTLRSGTVGGSPLTFYVMIPPFNQIDGREFAYNSTKNQTTNIIVDYIANNTTLMQVQLHNASYNANFTFKDGFQAVQVNTSAPINDVHYLAGYHNETLSPDYDADVNITRLTLNQTGAENLAYQAVMEAFTSLFLGSVRLDDSLSASASQAQIDTNTSVAMTSLLEAREMASLSDAISGSNTNLGNTNWDGASVVTNQTSKRGVTDLMEEMFRNATISLMSSSALNPNYSSPYAPSNGTVYMWSYNNQYEYDRTTLWATYAVAIGISIMSVMAGTYVVLTTQASYSNSFSTFLRVSHNIHISREVRLEDTSGRGSLPKDLADAMIGFPPENTLASEVVHNYLDSDRMRLNGTYTGLSHDGLPKKSS